MAITFTGSITLNARGSLLSDVDLGSAANSVDYQKRYDIANGTSASQANMMWSDTRTINASSAEDLDLAGGLTGALGNTITFTTIKGIIIKAADDNTNNVVIGGDDSAAFINWVGDATDTIVVKPGGIFVLYDPSAGGYAVTATTGDLLQIANSGAGTSVTYDIILIGEVA